MKKKLLILNIGTVLAILFALIYSIAAGGRYTYSPSHYISNSTIKDFSVSYDKEGIVELEDVRLSEGSYRFIADFKAVGRGSTRATITYTSEYNDVAPEDAKEHEMTEVVDLSVNFLGVITDRSAGFNFTGYKIAIYAILFILLLVEVITLWIFADGLRKGQFSYHMVSFGGIGIFALVLFLFSIYKMSNQVIWSFSEFLHLFHSVGTLVFIGLAPLMFIMAALLAFSNIWLMRHEGYRPANALGIVFAVLWILGTGFMVLLESGNIFPSTPVWVLTFAWFIITYFECMFISTVVSAFLATKFKVPYGKDYIIILGCGIRKDGTLTPLLKGRVDRALKFEEEQFKKTEKHAVFVPSGGQGPSEVIPEAHAMENYLLSQGVPAERIRREDKSTNTLQNMQFSKAVIEADCGDIKDKKIAFSTTNYHVFRGYILSQKCGFYAQGLSAKTRAYFYPNAFLREFMGLLVDQKLRHIVVLVFLLLCLLLTYFI